MARYADCLATLPNFRNEILRRSGEPGRFDRALTTRGAFSSRLSPAANIHATGAGLRHLGDNRYDTDPDNIVLKVFVFDEELARDEDNILSSYNDIPVSVEHLPVQVVRSASGGWSGGVETAAEDETEAGALNPRSRHRPIPGGVSISPLQVQYAGTLGCYLRRPRVDMNEVLALSNNHVLADTDRLRVGTSIVQPGPEGPSFTTRPADVFACLDHAIPIHFPSPTTSAPVNQFDAATAIVTDLSLIQTGEMYGIPSYDPSQVVRPLPGMDVIKAGRTTGVTHGQVVSVNVDGILVNYGGARIPRIAAFNDVVQVIGVDEESPFSMPGDSGSVILEEETGHPLALLFAGDGVHTTACDLGQLCQHLGAWPI